MSPHEFVPCNLCGSEHARFVVSKFGLNLVQCRLCKLVYANPRLEESERSERYESSLFFMEYLKSLRATPLSYDISFIRNHYHLFLNLLNKYCSPGNKLLDVGCGGGFFLKAAEEAGWNVEGVEISTMASNYAKDVVKVKVYNETLENLSLPHNTYDSVTLLDLLEHLPDPLFSLKEVHRIMRNRGILLLNTPDYNSLSNRILGQDWAVLSPAEHFYYFTRKTLDLMLSRAGFHVLDIQNLLVFNPEYTHKKSGWRYSLWKNIHGRLERMKSMEALHGIEFLELMNIGGPKEKNLAGLPYWKKWKRQLYRKAKRWLRGDFLVAVAQKEMT